MRYVCEFDYSESYLLRDIVNDETESLETLTSELGIGLDGGQLIRCYPLSLTERAPASGFVRRDEVATRTAGRTG